MQPPEVWRGEVKKLRKVYEHAVDTNLKTDDELRAERLQAELDRVYDAFKSACYAGRTDLRLQTRDRLDDITIDWFRTAGVQLSTIGNDQRNWKFDWLD